MESDICGMMRAMAEVLNALAEVCEKILDCIKDLAEKLEGQTDRKLRPDYKDRCKIRWLDILDKTMQWRLRRFC